MKKQAKEQKLTPAKQELEDERDLLISLVVELKKHQRAKIINSKKQIQYLNRIANKILDSDKGKLKQYSLKLNQLIEEQED